MIICNVPQPSLVRQLFLPALIAIISAWFTYKFTIYRERRHKKEHLKGILTVLNNLIKRNLLDVNKWLNPHTDKERKSLIAISETNYHELFSQVTEYPKYLIQCTSIMSNFDFKHTTEFIYSIQSNSNTARSRGQEKFLSLETANNLVILFGRAIDELTKYQEEIAAGLRAKRVQIFSQQLCQKFKLIKDKCRNLYH